MLCCVRLDLFPTYRTSAFAPAHASTLSASAVDAFGDPDIALRLGDELARIDALRLSAADAKAAQVPVQRRFSVRLCVEKPRAHVLYNYNMRGLVNIFWAFVSYFFCIFLVVDCH